MKVRRATTADANALWAVWNMAAVYDPMSMALFEEKVHADADALTLVAETRGRTLGFITLVPRTLPGEIRGVVKLISVDPAAQDRGVGTMLLREAEGELASCGATTVRVAESFPNYLTPGIDVRYERACSFFASRGYTPFAEAVNLEVDLGGWQASRRTSRPLPEGIEIRRATENDKQAVADLIGTHWPPWWGEVSQALANSPATLFLAWQGPNLVGFAAHDANNRSTGWFGPMGTAPQSQGQGIGVALLHAALDDMHQRGDHRATIPWVGPVEFYERHAGARLVRRFQRFEKPLTPCHE